jgi:HD superfamily phosphohydrolase
MSHEAISLLIMERLNAECDGQLQTAIDIFRDTHPKRFLHQLVSGQLDVDRMDYLARDSFFTGVIEGTIGYDRILKMLTVHDDMLMVEEKGIYSIEKFLVARRLMYWQVYLHKTVISAEVVLVRIFERARALAAAGDTEVRRSDALGLFLFRKEPLDPARHLAEFCRLDDADVIVAIKQWSFHPDRVLAILCQALLDRKLFKLRLQSEPVPESELAAMQESLKRTLRIGDEEVQYLAFTGTAVNRLYNPNDERIDILFRDGSVRDISQVDHALIHQTLSQPVKKFYLCYFPANL